MLYRIHAAAGAYAGLRSATAAAAAAASAATAPWAGLATSASCPSSHTGEAECLYAVLGVKQGATLVELKAAFRKRAKELHPDAAPGAGAANSPAFVQLLAAYKVLSNPRARQLYDLSRDTAGPSVLRAAAASGVHGAAEAAYEEAPVDLSWGLGRLLNDPPGQGGALDHLRQELRGELHSAVRRAYLGPRVQAEELESGWLPDAFEADERAANDCPDLLQLVSGRQVLGAVREWRAALLAQQAQRAAAALGDSWVGAGAAPGLAPGVTTASGASSDAQHTGHAAVARWQDAEDGDARASERAALQQAAEQLLGHEQGARQHSEHGQHAPPQGTAAGAPRQDVQQHAQHTQRDPDLLELFVGNRLVATAVRHFPRTGGSSRSGGDSPADAAGSRARVLANRGRQDVENPSLQEGLKQGQRGEQPHHHHHDSSHSQQPGPGNEQPQQQDHQQAHQADQAAQQAQRQAQQQVPAEVIGIYAAPSGQLLAQVEAQQLDPGSATASSARLLDAAGRHTHTVYRTQTPLVRHLTFTAEPDAFGMRTKRPKRLVVCRARRAWLPPSSLWLFKPLSYEHDVGGWYLEWAGQEQRHHPACLHPAVFVLTAAFDSLDHERAARQPLGLFARLRAEKEEAGGGARQRGGWRGWLSSALRFHGAGQH